MARERELDSQDAFTALMERMLAIQQQQAAALQVQTERTAPRENPNYVTRSVFMKPSGEPWAQDLKCEMYFGPFPLKETPLTEAEVIAWNQVQPLEKGLITKLDGSLARVTVRAKEDAVGRIERLTVELLLKKDDNPQHFPSLVAMATELAAQVPVPA